MPTISAYNHTAGRFMSGQNLSTDTYKVLLLNASAVFDATHTTLAEVTSSGANEVSGNGWPVGGLTLTGVTIGTVTTNDAAMDADDLSQAISGGDITFSAYVLYNDTATDDPPIAFVALDAPQTIVNGNLLGIQWNASGIIGFNLA